MRYRIARNTINVKQRTLELDARVRSNQITADDARRAIGELYAQLAVSVDTLKSYSADYNTGPAQLAQADRAYHDHRRALEDVITARERERRALEDEGTRIVHGSGRGPGLESGNEHRHRENQRDNQRQLQRQTEPQTTRINTQTPKGRQRAQVPLGAADAPDAPDVSDAPDELEVPDADDTGLDEVFNTALERSTQLRSHRADIILEQTPPQRTRTARDPGGPRQVTRGSPRPSSTVREMPLPSPQVYNQHTGSTGGYMSIRRASPRSDPPRSEDRREETLGSPVSFAPPALGEATGTARAAAHRRDLSSLGSTVLSDIPVATPVVAHRVRPQVSYPFMPGRSFNGGYSDTVGRRGRGSFHDVTTTTSSAGRGGLGTGPGPLALHHGPGQGISAQLDRLKSLQRRAPDLDATSIQRELAQCVRALEHLAVSGAGTTMAADTVPAQRYSQLERRLANKAAELDRVQAALARAERERDDALVVRETARRPLRAGVLSVAQRMLVYQYDSARMRARRQDLEFILQYQRLELDSYAEERKAILDSIGYSPSPPTTRRPRLRSVAMAICATLRFARRGTERRQAKQLLAFRLQQTGAEQRRAASSDNDDDNHDDNDRNDDNHDTDSDS